MPRTTKAAASRSEANAPKLSQAERAYAELRRMILDDELPAGSQILEQEAALRLGMSRTPVREAMLRLARDGIVEVRPRHGMRVLPISADDMAEIYDLLYGLESTAAEIVAERGASVEGLAALDRAVADMERALGRDDRPGWAAADERFHLLLVELTGNRRLIDAVGTYWEQAHRVRMATLRLRPKPERSNEDHRALVGAIRARAPERARAIHAEHRKRSGVMLVALLRELGLKAL
jgi:DNA-binding GntR family transcriptional regulator